MVWRATFIFCCFRLISEVANTPTSPAVDFNQTTDGELFIKELLNGQKAIARPGQLSFTAPYKLCGGRHNCSRNNFAMIFPLYIGKYGREYYKNIYSKDYETVYSKNTNAPFRRSTTRRPFTLCPSAACTSSTNFAAVKYTEDDHKENLVSKCPPLNPTSCVPNYKRRRITSQHRTSLSLTVMLILFDMGKSKLRWDKWSWTIPQEPIEYFFRRHEQMPVKNPSPKCQCPPHKECAVQYELNEDALHFLSIRGLISNSELSPSKETAKSSSARTKRDVNGDMDEEPCCCPPKNIMTPTFISDKRFDEFVDRLDKKQNALRT